MRGFVVRAGARRRRQTCVAISALAIACLALPASSPAAGSKTITVGAATPDPLGDCRGFGEASNPLEPWRPYMGFVYQNLPPFHLKVGDGLGFDLMTANDQDIQLEIAMSPATNGTAVNTAPFTTVVTNNQAPRNPRGDDTVGDYELGYVSEGDFDFPGGGLIIRLSNPAAALAADDTCDGRVAGANNLIQPDASGFFLSRVYGDADGVSPWDHSDASSIAQFRLIIKPSSNRVKLGKLIRNTRRGTALLPLTVKGPGTLTVSGRGVKARTAAAAAAGKVRIPIRPTGRLRKRLDARQRARVGITVGFSPGGDPPGDSSAKRRIIKLVKRP
jgi:hypothetical protein